MTPPLVKGGQGRDGAEVQASAVAVILALLLAAAVAITLDVAF